VTSIDVPGHDVVGLRASNPGPFTLSGTNSWLVGRAPTWLIDPGPALGPHVEALLAEISARGGLGGIALTHDHADHSEAVDSVRRRIGTVPVAAARGEVDVLLGDGDPFGPLVAMPIPGHAPDHLAFVVSDVAFTGDAVLGEGSVFISPDPGAMTGYLDGLRRLQELGPRVLCPGHGPLVLDAMAKLDEYLEHRLDREHRLVAALGRGTRTVDELLEQVWGDAPEALRPAAAVTLAAHLDKLAEEGRLPEGVERPRGVGLS
jgi:glyoxylase-like metal-dependent hydrolase (beta-lactamase superfamily II)